MKKILIALFLTISTFSFGQDKIPVTEKDYNNNNVEMADTLRSDGKIYVVVGIVLVIMLGLLFYTITIDRKLNKLEKEHELED